MVVWGCWHRGRAEGGDEGSSKELVAQNNGKSSVYLMARNHAILSSTASVGLLPRCRPSVRAGSALISTLTRPPPAGQPTREGGTNSKALPQSGCILLPV